MWWSDLENKLRLTSFFYIIIMIFFLQNRSLVECCIVSVGMSSCESKLVSRSSRKATVAKTVLVE